MTREELLKELQDRGLTDDEIRGLLQETLDLLTDEQVEPDEAEEASKLLGVKLD